VLRLLSSVAGVLGIRYFLLPPEIKDLKVIQTGKRVWLYIVLGMILFSCLFYFFPVNNAN
jgi:hypothetical protein